MTSVDLQSPPPWISLIWPPDGFIHAASRVENSRGVTVAPVAVHPSLCLAGQVGVHQGGARRCASARRDHPGGRAIPPGNHGELVRAGWSAVVEIRCAAGLEGSALALGGARVRRGKVGVVVGAAQRHGRGHGRGVGEGGRVVHPRAGEAGLCERGEAWELTLKLPGERAQVGGTWRCTHTNTLSYFGFSGISREQLRFIAPLCQSWLSELWLWTPLFSIRSCKVIEFNK